MAQRHYVRFQKVAGVLIENSLKGNGTFSSVIGIGLNLNQTNFEDLPQATSLTCITGEIYEPEQLALLLRDSLKKNIQLLSQNPEFLWVEYH